MKIGIADALQNEGELYTGEYDGPFETVTFMGEKYAFTGGVHVSADYFADSEGIVVTGSFEAQTQVSCSRCLTEFKYTADFKFSEYYKESAQDGEYVFAGESIDLMPMLADNLVLSLPTKQLCRQDCNGLCGKCGIDLNEGSCGCEEQIDESNPFYGLANLNHDEEV